MIKQEPAILIAISGWHEILRKGLAQLISGLGNYEVVIETGNSSDLIEQLEQAAILPDICIMPLTMPGMNSYETISTIKVKWPSVKGMILSCVNNEFTIFNMYHCGASGYLVGNQTIHDLKIMLTEVHEKGFSLSGEVLSVLSPKLKRDIKDPQENMLKEKEISFLKLCCEDISYQKIAEQMCLSLNTIHDYRKNLFRKLKVRSRIGLMLYGIQNGLVPYNRLQVYS